MANAAPTPLNDFDWGVRFEVYRHFAHEVQPPAAQALGRALGAEEGAVAASLRRLHANHHVAVFPDRDEVWMANPFSAVPTEYPVRTARGRYWAACAWDAFGVPALLGIDAVMETRCPESGQPLEFGVRGGELFGDDGVIHLVVPLRDAWNDIGFT